MKARTGFQSGYSMCGYLVVGPEARESAIRGVYETMRERGVEVELCGVDRILELEPRLAAHDLAIGCYEPTGGHAQPLFVADGFIRAAERDGATIRLGTTVTGLRPDGQGWSLWLGDGTRASAEIVIVACGPWANKLTRSLGGVVPLALSRGQAGRFRPPPAFGLPGPIISDHAHELWIKPEGNDGHYLVGGRGGRLDRSPYKRATGLAGADDSMLETFAGELAHRFPGMAGGVWRGSWSSFYDFTPDGNPVIDVVPGRPGLIVATGMSGHCFKLAPSLGLGTAELVVDGFVRSFDWSVFAYGRFARRANPVGGGRGPG
jgi:sarcosine oxidase, subunit beta